MYLMTNISAQVKLLTEFYKQWLYTYPAFVANIVDDYVVTNKEDELEQLIRLHCGRACLYKNMVLFDDVYVKVTEENTFDPPQSHITMVFIYKYRPKLYINVTMNIQIDRPQRLIHTDGLITMKQRHEDEWEGYAEEYFQGSFSFAQIKDVMKGCLI